MKKSILNLMLMGFVAVFASCSSDEPTPEHYEPGQIPGLGNEPGELTGLPFELPEGITVTGDITGKSSQSGYWNLQYNLASRFLKKDGTMETRMLAPRYTRNEVPEIVEHYFGSGYGYVDLLLPLHNSRNRNVTVTFPAGLVLRNVAGDCQNGVLIKKVTVEIPAGADYNLNLAFYCGNKNKGSAGSSDVYTLGVVSNAAPLIDLCERVKNKKINIEEFDPTSPEEYDVYCDQRYELQQIVWDVTDRDGLDEEAIEYLNSLPNSR